MFVFLGIGWFVCLLMLCVYCSGFELFVDLDVFGGVFSFVGDVV